MDIAILLLCLCFVAVVAIFIYVIVKQNSSSPSPSSTPPAPTSLPDQTDKLANCPLVKICRPGDGSANHLTHCSDAAECEYGWEVTQDPAHRAILFHAGDYTATDLSYPPLRDVSPRTLVVGYYQSAMGLSPTGAADVKVLAVQVETGKPPDPCALDNFWRSISNITVEQHLNWFVSQASPFRQMKVKGETNLTKGVDGGCYASGGYGANSILKTVNMKGNQQWLLRNCNFETWTGDMWNNVALGCMGTVQPGAKPCLTATITTNTLPGGVPPFLAYKKDAYGIVIPKFYSSQVPQGQISISDTETFLSLRAGEVYVATEANFDHAALSNAVNAGLSVLFTPGTYRVNLQITHSDVVVIGIGQPILQGAPAIRISAPGVTLSGLLMESVAVPAADPGAILIVDSHGQASPESPCRLIDIWVRHGAKTLADSRALPALQDLVAIRQSYTYVDNMWAWRQDHTTDRSGGVGRGVAIAQHAIHVYAEARGVTCVGVQAEHSLKSPVLWEGPDGTLIFLQVELPYEMSKDTLTPGLVVDAENFTGRNLGVYIYTPKQWKCKDCNVRCGVQVTEKAHNPKIHNVITVQLNTKGGMNSVIGNVLCAGDTCLGNPTSKTENGKPVCINSYPSDLSGPSSSNHMRNYSSGRLF